MKDFRGGGPYLLLSCLPAAAYQLHSVHPNISEGGSAFRLTALCHCLTAEAFNVWCEIRPRGQASAPIRALQAAFDAVNPSP